MKKFIETIKDIYPVILFIGGLIAYCILKYTNKIP